MSHDLAAKLLDRARQAELSGKPLLADPDLAQAKRWGADPKDILAVQQTVPVPKPATAGPDPERRGGRGLDARAARSQPETAEIRAAGVPVEGARATR